MRCGVASRRGQAQRSARGPRGPRRRRRHLRPGLTPVIAGAGSRGGNRRRGGMSSSRGVEGGPARLELLDLSVEVCPGALELGLRAPELRHLCARGGDIPFELDSATLQVGLFRFEAVHCIAPCTDLSLEPRDLRAGADLCLPEPGLLRLEGSHSRVELGASGLQPGQLRPLVTLFLLGCAHLFLQFSCRPRSIVRSVAQRVARERVDP
mmetsp:Transcript_10667/g.31744  ORF Transcript_10667/g.31744 Transcript_10667/m.31744 type:complete len:209 (-) Transcript_10667:506-1132(-)